jgi:hypothetical protein
VESVRLIRNSAITHVIDADQRHVVLPVVKRSGQTVTVAGPPNGDVAPPGPYMLFVNRKDEKGAVPSKAKMLMVGQVPVARSCVSRRAFTVHVKRAFRKDLRSAVVTLNGKRVRTLKGRRAGGADHAQGHAEGRQHGAHRDAAGQRQAGLDTRRFRTCTPKRAKR